MKTAILAAVAAATLTSVTPAFAQDWNGYRGHGYDRGSDYGRDHRDRDDWRRADYCQGGRAPRLYTRIRHEVREGDLDWRIARDLRAAVDRTADMERRYCADGVNRWEAQRLDRQYDQIEASLRHQSRG